MAHRMTCGLTISPTECKRKWTINISSWPWRAWEWYWFTTLNYECEPSRQKSLQLHQTTTLDEEPHVSIYSMNNCSGGVLFIEESSHCSSFWKSIFISLCLAAPVGSCCSCLGLSSMCVTLFWRFMSIELRIKVASKCFFKRTKLFPPRETFTVMFALTQKSHLTLALSVGKIMSAQSTQDCDSFKN